MKTTTQKQGTRGQAQIFRENRETIRNYSLASAIASAIYLLVHLLLIEHTAWSAWSAFMVSGGLELLAVVLMKSSAKSLKGEKGQIIDAGVDLNSEHSFGEYYKDTIILCVIVQLLALVSSYFFLLLLVFPAFGGYKAWVGFIGPWVFAPAPEPDPTDEKRQRRKQKVVYRR